jgi:2-dehydropantoate 2-reductase
VTRFAVMGSGGVGGYFGARLAAAGADVTFIARGAHLNAIRGCGLTIISPLGDVTVQPAQATDRPGDIGPVDVVLFATKLWDTETAGEACRPLMGADTAVVSLQNGVDAEDRLAVILGSRHVMGGVSQIAAVIERPGVIRHNGDFAIVNLGERDGIATPRAEALRDALVDAGIKTILSPDINKAIWQKFIMLVGLSALSTVTGQTIGPIRDNPESHTLLEQVMGETAAVARARGIDDGDDILAKALALVDGLPATMTSSMAGDHKRGNRLELDWLSGAVVRIGAELGVPTPANQTIVDTLTGDAGGSA